jgi:hypothetical protein
MAQTAGRPVAAPVRLSRWVAQRPGISRSLEHFRTFSVLSKMGGRNMDFRQVLELAKRFDEKLQLATETCNLAKRDRLLREARELDRMLKNPEPVSE